MRYDRNSPVPSILDLREVLCTATNAMVVVPNQQCGCGAKRIGQCSSDLTTSVSRPSCLPVSRYGHNGMSRHSSTR